MTFAPQVPFTYVEYDSGGRLWPGVRQAYQAVDRFQLVNSYGLFRRMTGVGGRPEVVVEGSQDRVTWTVRGGCWGFWWDRTNPHGIWSSTGCCLIEPKAVLTLVDVWII